MKKNLQKRMDKRLKDPSFLKAWKESEKEYKENREEIKKTLNKRTE